MRLTHAKPAPYASARSPVGLRRLLPMPQQPQADDLLFGSEKVASVHAMAFVVDAQPVASRLYEAVSPHM